MKSLGVWKIRSLILFLACLISIAGLMSCTTPKMDIMGDAIFTKGGIRVITQPSGADIKINEKKVGRAPLMEPLEAGIYRIEAKKRGYDPIEQWVTVEKGKTAEITLKFNSPD